MLKSVSKNRFMGSFMILSIAAFSIFMTACAPETIVKEVEVIKEVQVEVPVEVIKEVIKEGATITREVEVIKEVAGETVIKEIVKEVIKEVEVKVEVEKEVIVVATPMPVITGAGGQQYGGTLKLGIIDFGAMDPSIMGLSEGSAIYSNHTYDNLTEPWYDGGIVNRLAETWSANDDLSVYTINVRQGVTFHDGSALTSADVKWTFDRIMDETTASPLLGEIDYISEITTPDAATAIFTLKGSNTNLPQDISDYHARIVPDGITQETLQESSTDFGSGPYTLGDHNPAEEP